MSVLFLVFAAHVGLLERALGSSRVVELALAIVRDPHEVAASVVARDRPRS